MRRVRVPSPLLGLSSLAISFALVGCMPAPNGKIAGDSQTDECAAELVGALEAIGRDEGYAFEVSEADAKTIFSSGQITKQYARDGASYEAFFGVGKNGECNLALYKERVKRPGETTSRGKSRWVDLETCTCE